MVMEHINMSPDMLTNSIPINQLVVNVGCNKSDKLTIKLKHSKI